MLKQVICQEFASHLQTVRLAATLFAGITGQNGYLKALQVKSIHIPDSFLDSMHCISPRNVCYDYFHFP